MRPPDAPLAPDADRTRRARDAFDAAGVDHARVRERFGVANTPNASYGRREVPRLLRRCPDDEPFGVLARLFMLGVPVADEVAARVLGTATTDDLLALGLLGRAAGGGLVGEVRITPADELLLASEAPWSPHPPDRDTQVMSVSGSTRQIAQHLVPQDGGTALDLGTGCGALALLAAARSARVVATDCNPRALNLAAFNAHFNRFGNVEFRAGDLFAPVGGDAFDRVITNPPYVLTPPADGPGAKRVMFRDGGFRADGLSEAVVRGIPRHLRPGGFGQTLINWACVKGEDWRDRVRGWVEGSGCDAWLLRFDLTDPDRYTTAWAPSAGAADGDFPAYQAEFAAWMAYYEREGIEAIGAGLLTLRKRESGPTWFAEDPAPDAAGPCGEAVARGFRLRDFLLSGPADLLGVPFRLAPEARWTRTFTPVPGGWAAAGSHVRLAAGLTAGCEANGLGMEVLTRCRGDRPLGAVLADLAAATKRTPEELAATAVPFVRSLVESGVLLPAGV